MDDNIREAFDTVNQMYETTNRSMSDHYAERQRRLQKAYEQLASDVLVESATANTLLSRFIDNSSTVITSMQDYFDIMMTSTVERAYADMNSMLNRAIAKIQNVCVDIVTKFKAANSSTQVPDLPSQMGRLPSAISMADALVLALEQVQELAEKFKQDVNAKLGANSLAQPQPQPSQLVTQSLPTLVVQQPQSEPVSVPIAPAPAPVPVIPVQAPIPVPVPVQEPVVERVIERVVEPIVIETPPSAPKVVIQETPASTEQAAQQRTIELAKKLLSHRNRAPTLRRQQQASSSRGLSGSKKKTYKHVSQPQQQQQQYQQNPATWYY